MEKDLSSLNLNGTKQNEKNSAALLTMCIMGKHLNPKEGIHDQLCFKDQHIQKCEDLL
jgi:hypothetical protein